MSAPQAATATSESPAVETVVTGTDTIEAPRSTRLSALADDLTAGQRTDTTTGRPLRADALRNQQRILDAVRDLARGNPDEIVMEKVAKAAGVGIGTLYRRFPTRLALLEAAYREEVAQLAAQADELSRTLSPGEALDAWVRRLGQYVATKKAYLREQQDADAQQGQQTMTQSREIIIAAAETLLARVQGDGSVRPDIEPMDLIRLVSGCSMMATDDPVNRERMLEVVLAGLRR